MSKPERKFGNATVKTDLREKHFRYRYEVPASILERWFDWLDEDSDDGFFCYRGTWYHLSQFISANDNGWQGYHSDSYFSGVVLRLSPDGETYIVGTYIS